MAYEIKPGTGTVFKNEYYEKEGTKPYARGKVKTPDGKEYDVALWIPKSDKIKGFNMTIREPYVSNNASNVTYEDLNPKNHNDLPF